MLNRFLVFTRLLFVLLLVVAAMPALAQNEIDEEINTLKARLSQ
jgi:hypothetical protein